MGKNYFQMYFHSVFCNNNNISTLLIFFSHDWVDLFGLLMYTGKSYNITWQLLCSSWNALISDLSASFLKISPCAKAEEQEGWYIRNLHPLWEHDIPASSKHLVCLMGRLIGLFILQMRPDKGWNFDSFSISLSEISDHPLNSTFILANASIFLSLLL